MAKNKCEKKLHKKDLLTAQRHTQKNKERRMRRDSRRQDKKIEHLIRWATRRGVREAGALLANSGNAKMFRSEVKAIPRAAA